MWVYLIESLSVPGKRYVGLTRNLHSRLDDHNAGKTPYTSKYRPWRIVAAVWFAAEARARAFETYLRSGSGHAFAKRHFW
jgi:putative endonuclease